MKLAIDVWYEKDDKQKVRQERTRRKSNFFFFLFFTNNGIQCHLADCVQFPKGTATKRNAGQIMEEKSLSFGLFSRGIQCQSADCVPFPNTTFGVISLKSTFSAFSVNRQLLPSYAMSWQTYLASFKRRFVERKEASLLKITIKEKGVDIKKKKVSTKKSH